MKTISFDNYLSDCKYSLSTHKMYNYEVTRYLQSNPDAASYQFSKIVAYIISIHDKSGGHYSAGLLLAGIKKYYDYLLATGKIRVNPIRRFSIKSKKKSIIGIDLFTTSELDSLMTRPERYEILKLRNQIIISLLIYQGLGATEICKINIKDIYFDREGMKAKGNRIIKARLLNLKPSQIVLFENYLGHSYLLLNKFNSSALLLGKTGNAITVDEINYLIETAKFMFPNRNLNPKTIRKSVIYNWLNHYDLPLEDVQILAGHKRISATFRYKMPNLERMITLTNKFHPI
jgi:integrase/recombinase XerD